MLPIEIILIILQYCDDVTKMNILKTCKKIYSFRYEIYFNNYYEYSKIYHNKKYKIKNIKYDISVPYAISNDYIHIDYNNVATIRNKLKIPHAENIMIHNWISEYDIKLDNINFTDTKKQFHIQNVNIMRYKVFSVFLIDFLVKFIEYQIIELIITIADKMLKNNIFLINIVNTLFVIFFGFSSYVFLFLSFAAFIIFITQTIDYVVHTIWIF